jgi:hypothetical protein
MQQLQVRRCRNNSICCGNNCDGTSTLTTSEYTGTLLWSTGAASITVQTAATYTVTTTKWMYKFTRFRRCRS